MSCTLLLAKKHITILQASLRSGTSYLAYKNQSCSPNNGQCCQSRTTNLIIDKRISSPPFYAEARDESTKKLFADTLEISFLLNMVFMFHSGQYKQE